jgi:hypothetical protein
LVVLDTSLEESTIHETFRTEKPFHETFVQAFEHPTSVSGHCFEHMRLVSPENMEAMYQNVDDGSLD